MLEQDRATPTPEPEPASAVTTKSTESTESAESTTSPEVKALHTFLQTDLRIKRELMDLAPSEANLIDEDACIEYVDQAYKAFRGLRHDFALLENIFSDPSDRRLCLVFRPLYALWRSRLGERTLARSSRRRAQ